MAKEVEIPKTIKGLTKEMFKSPLLLLASRRELYWWRFMLHCRYFVLTHRLNSGKKVYQPTRDELQLVTGLMDLLTLLEEIELCGNNESVLGKLIERHERAMQAQRQHYENLLDQSNQEFNKMAALVDRSCGLARDCMDMRQEDAPVSGDWLSRANIGLRLQRPHKSN